MSTSDPTQSAQDVERAAEPPADDEARERVETYDTDEGVVFYDAQNPLAWMLASSTLVLSEQR